MSHTRLIMLKVFFPNVCPFYERALQCCYFKRPRPAEHLWSILRVGVSVWDQCPVSPHHMISLTMTINHPVRLKLQGLCFILFLFFFSPRGRARFSNDFWKALMLKNKQVKTEGLHLTLWELIQNASTALLVFFFSFSFFNLSSHTSAQTDNNVCIITARETGRVMQIRERHLHTLSIKFFSQAHNISLSLTRDPKCCQYVVHPWSSLECLGFFPSFVSAVTFRARRLI